MTTIAGMNRTLGRPVTIQELAAELTRSMATQVSFAGVVRRNVEAGEMVKLSDLMSGAPKSMPGFMGLDEDKVVTQLQLKPTVAEVMSVGDIILLERGGPSHTILAKEGNTIYVVEGSYQRTRRPLDAPKKPAPEFKPPVIVGKRRIRLDE